MDDGTLVDTLLRTAREQPDAVAFGFLTDGDDTCVEMTYRELATEARRIASLLLDRSAPGSRAVLVYPPGLDFIAGFFACLLAGVVAVPAYPPVPPGKEAAAQRFRGIVRGAAAELVLTTADYLAFRDADPLMRTVVDVPWLATDRRRLGAADDRREPDVRPDSVALIQYTSGATGDPKGVVLRHDALLANQRAIQCAMDSSERTVGVSWLPMYHDMGLIGFVIHPLFLGIPSYLMSPLHFLERPIRWLRAISRYGATISGAPNFAYELCLRRITPQEEEAADLDLSSWMVAFIGSEPVRAAPLRRFADRFAARGLRREALYPCYGLAEASLLVTGSVPLAGLRTTWLDGVALGNGMVEPTTPDQPGAVEVVSSGRPPEGVEVAVIDRESGDPLPDGQVGEIWTRGPSVAAGYWGRPEQTEATFRALLPGRPAEPFLRTGDLGFLLVGELYVTGRAKELMIVHGRNVYPQDIELAAQDADSRVRNGCGAAFGIVVGESEEVALVQEVSATDEPTLRDLMRTIRHTVADAHGIRLAAICLVPPRALPRTSSGKLKRGACRDAFLDGRIKPLVEWLDTALAGV